MEQIIILMFSHLKAVIAIFACCAGYAWVLGCLGVGCLGACLLCLLSLLCLLVCLLVGMLAVLDALACWLAGWLAWLLAGSIDA